MAAIVRSTVYLHFTTNCEEAMKLYQECFGGEISLIRVGDTPMAGQMPGMENLIMHSSLSMEGWAICASDWCAPSERVQGNNFSVMVECASHADQDAIMAKLSEGGKVSMPLSDTFWNSRFGMVKDRFGVDWMLNCEK